MPPAELTTRHVRILLALVDGPRHGYAISQDIEEETGGQITLRPGSLYRALHQLTERGLIRDRPVTGDDPRRRPYTITAAGRRALAAELAGMGRLVERGRELRAVDRKS